jgi:hypothetical protein
LLARKRCQTSAPPPLPAPSFQRHKPLPTYCCRWRTWWWWDCWGSLGCRDHECVVELAHCAVAEPVSSSSPARGSLHLSLSPISLSIAEPSLCQFSPPYHRFYPLLYRQDPPPDLFYPCYRLSHPTLRQRSLSSPIDIAPTHSSLSHTITLPHTPCYSFSLRSLHSPMIDVIAGHCPYWEKDLPH